MSYICIIVIRKCQLLCIYCMVPRPIVDTLMYSTKIFYCSFRVWVGPKNKSGIKFRIFPPFWIIRISVLLICNIWREILKISAEFQPHNIFRDKILTLYVMTFIGNAFVLGINDFSILYFLFFSICCYRVWEWQISGS